MIKPARALSFWSKSVFTTAHASRVCVESLPVWAGPSCHWLNWHILVNTCVVLLSYRMISRNVRIIVKFEMFLLNCVYVWWGKNVLIVRDTCTG